jgi:hypothetical protein
MAAAQVELAAPAPLPLLVAPALLHRARPAHRPPDGLYCCVYDRLVGGVYDRLFGGVYDRLFGGVRAHSRV